MKKRSTFNWNAWSRKNNHRKRSFNGIKDEFLDMDEFIERSTGKEIKELFAQGEEVFRDLESKSCELLSTLKMWLYLLVAE